MENQIQIEEMISLYREMDSRYQCEESFHEFVKQAWHLVEGRRPFIDGWHIQAICEHLEAIMKGEIRFLLLNIPPGCCKSTLVSVLFPVWCWIKKPELRFLCASYAFSLAQRDLLKARAIIESRWFKSRWGHLFYLTKKIDYKFQNNKQGYRIATSVEGTGTGEGGDGLITDDLNNVQDSLSEAITERTERFWNQTWPTRLRDDKKGFMVNIQQRTNLKDVTGLILSSEYANEWIKFILPMEFDPTRKCKTIPLPSTKGKPWQDPRTKQGQLLWPEFKDKVTIQRLKKQLKSEYAISGQLQQLPVPAEGAIIKKHWFKPWKHLTLPKFIQIIQSWDTALTESEMSAYSACTTWGLFYQGNQVPHVMLLSMFRERLEYPDLRRMAIRLYEDYRDTGEDKIKIDGRHMPQIVLIEARVSGYSLVADLRRAGINAMGFDPKEHGDKIQRVRLITPYLESGAVWIPYQGPEFIVPQRFGGEFVELASTFPMPDTRDVIDTMSQVLLKITNSGWLTHPDNKDTLDTSMRPRDIPKWGD